MPYKDIKVTEDNGITLTIEETAKEHEPVNMENLSGHELEDACSRIFSNLGWIVKKNQIAEMEAGTFHPDIVLSDGRKVRGYVEVIASMEPEVLVEKKELMQAVIAEGKPELFILTNGMAFDVFYHGQFAGSQTVPPSLKTMELNARMMSYYNAIMKIKEERKNGK